MDESILITSLVLAQSFAFGAVQFLKTKVPSELKPLTYVAIAAVTNVALYYALSSDILAVQLLMAGITGSVGVTGGVDFYKHDVKQGSAL